MQWFRLYQEFATDPKVQMMSEQYQRRLIMLFCLRCNGHVTLHETEIVFQLRVTVTEWEETKAEFITRGFIDKHNNVLNWDKRQYVSDSSNTRVRRHRDKVKRYSNVTVTPPEQNRTEQIQKKNSPPDPTKKISDNDFLEKIKNNPAFTGLDINRELDKMDAWLLVHPGRKKSRRFITAWLSKCEAPLKPNGKITAPNNGVCSKCGIETTTVKSGKYVCSEHFFDI